MIYLDNAATTFPKPLQVRAACNKAFDYCANPGRSGHRLSIKASETIYDCREKISTLFDFDKPENIILTGGCTQSLNTVIKGVLKKGDHVVISSLEHNSVVRPVQKLKDTGIITYSIAEVFENDADATLDSFRKAINNNTKLVICTHASNVFGVVLPISRIGALAHFYGALMCVDVAQSAGVLSLSLKDETNIDYICAPGHKGLYGPMGTGFLIINSDTIPDSLFEGGTGSGSHILSQPEMLPDKFESGTLNLNGFAGLSAGIDFVLKKGINTIYEYELDLVRLLYNKLSQINDIELYTNLPSYNTHVPLISFNIKDIPCENVAKVLDDKFSVAVRAGLHCSPLAHRSFHTENIGTVRLAPSAFTSRNDIIAVSNAIFKVANYKKSFFDIAI